ncbi:MAG: anhydro-N-acetylmuramic acid kinase [Moraxella sp.]|nr:anhydro-N-acetylmuramic acid kinase [Moraxella sp.]
MTDLSDDVFMSDDRHFVGMMSGTSLDALDAVLCQFDDDTPTIIATHSEPFPAELRAILLALCTPNGTESLAVGEFGGFSELDFWGLASRLYGELASDVVLNLISKTKLTTDDITAIGCHGQTVRHRPKWRFSLQLLDPNILAERTGIAVVSDFRRRDMAVGGQGAPLVPAFHQAVFGDGIDDDDQTVILNLGGIANITVLGGGVVGYDTGVANLLMDGWIHRHQGVSYDKHGDWAKSGAINQQLLDTLMTHPFLAQSAPKSTGREQFNLAWLDETLVNFDITPVNTQATLCEFTALSASREIAKFAKTNNTLYVCGGGAYNTHLLTRLAHHLPNFTIHTTDTVGISPTWVESVAFAWLARQSMLMQTGNLPAVTGAEKGVVLGNVCFG